MGIWSVEDVLPGFDSLVQKRRIDRMEVEPVYDHEIQVAGPTDRTLGVQ